LRVKILIQILGLPWPVGQGRIAHRTSNTPTARLAIEQAKAEKSETFRQQFNIAKPASEEGELGTRIEGE